MGFEYKIIAKLTKKQISEIQGLLKIKKEFDRKYEFDTKTFYDFRQANNNGKMPNMSISFENDGIYICRYDVDYLWEHLEELKEYLDYEKITYIVLDYQD